VHSENERRATRSEAEGTRPWHEPPRARSARRPERARIWPKEVRSPSSSLTSAPPSPVACICYPSAAACDGAAVVTAPRRAPSECTHDEASKQRQPFAAPRAPERPPTQPRAPASALPGATVIGRCPIVARRNASKASYSLNQRWTRRPLPRNNMASWQ
jgi:hypothetical protein